MLRENTISEQDLSRIVVTDSAEEAVGTIRETALRRFGLTYGPLAKRRWFLGE